MWRPPLCFHAVGWHAHSANGARYCAHDRPHASTGESRLGAPRGSRTPGWDRPRPREAIRQRTCSFPPAGGQLARQFEVCVRLTIAAAVRGERCAPFLAQFCRCAALPLHQPGRPSFPIIDPAVLAGRRGTPQDMQKAWVALEQFSRSRGSGITAVFCTSYGTRTSMPSRGPQPLTGQGGARARPGGSRCSELEMPLGIRVVSGAPRGGQG
jgi:hypothetical protein